MNLDDMENLREATQNLALVTMNYFTELQAAGFTQEQALRLVINYQNSLVGTISNE